MKNNIMADGRATTVMLHIRQFISYSKWSTEIIKLRTFLENSLRDKRNQTKDNHHSQPQ